MIFFERTALMRVIRFISFFLVILQLSSCQGTLASKTGREKNWRAMVVSAREEASAIGVQIMRQGGNAFDAMAATNFALAVCYPFGGNIGGGGFMVYRLAGGESGTLDYREKAPLLAHRDMFLNDRGQCIPYSSRLGGKASGIPGTVYGVLTAHKKFGKLSRQLVMAPAIRLAREGLIVTQKQADNLNKYRNKFEAYAPDYCPFLKTPSWKAGDTLIQERLARTLEIISLRGINAFYTDLASKVIDEVNSHGGIFQLADFAEYRSVWRKPIKSNYDDYHIITMSLPSSGGVCLLQILHMLEAYDLSELEPNSADYIQLLVEAERRAYADRAYWLGDADFVHVPLAKLLDKEYAKQRMADYMSGRSGSSMRTNYGQLQESDETTHYSIVDVEGNAIASTTTLNGAYGSGLYIEKLGFFMNNEMDDFSAKPGIPNMYGLVGAKANEIAPGKRMLSSMTPTIIEKHDKLFMVLGTPGGSTIITSVLQTLLNVIEYDMTMQEAVDAPRFHHQWLPDEIRLEVDGFPQETAGKLKYMGYHINTTRTPIIGKVDAILVDRKGRLSGGADRRGDDMAIGLK